MSHLQLSHEIRAPAHAVFDFTHHHENYPQFFQGFKKFEWTVPCQQAGTRLKMEGEIAGIALPIEVETMEVVPDRKITAAFVSGLKGSMEWRFEPAEETTWVTLEANYEVPPGVLRRIADRNLVDRDLCCCMLKTLANLKERLEARSLVAG